MRGGLRMRADASLHRALYHLPLSNAQLVRIGSFLGSSFGVIRTDRDVRTWSDVTSESHSYPRSGRSWIKRQHGSWRFRSYPGILYASWSEGSERWWQRDWAARLRDRKRPWRTRVTHYHFGSCLHSSFGLSPFANLLVLLTSDTPFRQRTRGIDGPDDDGSPACLTLRYTSSLGRASVVTRASRKGDHKGRTIAWLALQLSTFIRQLLASYTRFIGFTPRIPLAVRFATSCTTEWPVTRANRSELGTWMERAATYGLRSPHGGGYVMSVGSVANRSLSS